MTTIKGHSRLQCIDIFLTVACIAGHIVGQLQVSVCPSARLFNIKKKHIYDAIFLFDTYGRNYCRKPGGQSIYRLIGIS